MSNMPLRVAGRLSLCVTITILAACQPADPGPAQTTAPTEPAATTTAPPPLGIPNFPAGFDWPADPALIEAEIKAGNTAKLREHSWWLWAGINSLQHDNRPVWWHWPTSTPAYPNQPQPGTINPPTPDQTDVPAHGLRASNAAHTPINLNGPIYAPPTITDGACTSTPLPTKGLPDGPRFQSNGDIMIAGVVYNGPAFDWINSAQLANANVLSDAWEKGQKDISEFPTRSIVLKSMYWPVRGDDFTALPVWHNNFPLDYGSYAGYETWNPVVIIDPRNKDPKKGLTGVTPYLFHILNADGSVMPTKTATGQIYPVEAFYHQQIDATLLGSMDPRDVAILNASACWLYNRPFQAGDYLVQVAMHLISKEIPQWTLQSAWWSDDPDAGPFAANRPDIPKDQAPGPWRHYLLTVEYGVPTDPGLLPASFNPYIELAAGHPVATNCRNCHIRAAWPRGGFYTPELPITNSYLANGGPGALADIPLTDPVFNGLMRTDFQWAVPDRTGIPAGTETKPAE